MMMTTNHERQRSVFHVDRDQWHASHINKFHFLKTQISSVPSVNCVHSDALLSNSNLFCCFYVTRRTSFSFLYHDSSVYEHRARSISSEWPGVFMSILDVVHVVHSNVFYSRNKIYCQFAVSRMCNKNNIRNVLFDCIGHLFWEGVVWPMPTHWPNITFHSIWSTKYVRNYLQINRDTSPFAMSHLGTPPHEPNSLFSLKDK